MSISIFFFSYIILELAELENLSIQKEVIKTEITIPMNQEQDKVEEKRRVLSEAV